VVDGTTVPTSQTIDYVKANVAPGYKGYRLHYKLANAEPITDTNVSVDGTIWALEQGDNYVMVDSGMVLGEVAKPQYCSAYGNWYVNIKDGVDPNIPKGGQLVNQDEHIFGMYKNDIVDIQNWVVETGNNAIYGKEDLAIAAAKFDTAAQYTVDYQILKQLHAQVFGSLSLQYAQSMYKAVESIAEAIEARQLHDSALDTLVDLSMYEEGNIFRSVRATRAFVTGANEANVLLYLPYVKKKTVPIISLSNISIYALSDVGTDVLLTSADFSRPLFVYNPTYNGCVLIFTIKAGTNANYALNNGTWFQMSWKADCRGRV
jgi:hypothetical protein